MLPSIFENKTCSPHVPSFSISNYRISFCANIIRTENIQIFHDVSFDWNIHLKWKIKEIKKVYFIWVSRFDICYKQNRYLIVLCVVTGFLFCISKNSIETACIQFSSLIKVLLYFSNNLTNKQFMERKFVKMSCC